MVHGASLMAWLRENVASTAIDRVAYETVTRVLVVWFTDGDSHTYVGVPRAKFDSLISAGSVGTFFNRQIRGVYG